MAVVVLFAAMAVYLGYYIWRSGREAYITAPVTANTVGVSADVTGIVVRGETAVCGGREYCYYEVPSGGRVSAGGVIARVTDSADAMDSLRAKRGLEGEIARVKLILSDAGSSGSCSPAQRDAAAREGVVAIAAARASGDWAALDAAGSALSSVLMGGAEADAAVLAGLEAELDALNGAESGCECVVSPAAGLFMTSLDGLETLTPESLAGLTAAELGTLLTSGGEAPPDAIGRVIYSWRWYYAALMDEADALCLTAGGSATLSLDGCAGDVDARVDSVSAAENGKCAVVFSSIRRLGEAASLRLTDGSVLCSSLTGLRIPAEALHTDADGRDFVYAVEAMRLEIKYVTVLSGDGNGLLVEGDGSDDALAAGDSVIVGGEDMYEGMLIE